MAIEPSGAIPAEPPVTAPSAADPSTSVPPAPAPGEAWITTLDVGQGLAVLVRTANRALLYDAGPAFGADSDSGERWIVPYLRAAGVNHLGPPVERVQRQGVGHFLLPHQTALVAIGADAQTVHFADLDLAGEQLNWAERKFGNLRVATASGWFPFGEDAHFHARYPQAPVWPQSVQKSQPSLRMSALLPHSGHFIPGSVFNPASRACSISASTSVVGSPQAWPRTMLSPLLIRPNRQPIGGPQGDGVRRTWGCWARQRFEHTFGWTRRLVRDGEESHAAHLESAMQIVFPA